MVAAFQKLAQTLSQRIQARPEDPRVDAFQKLLHGEQRMDLAGVEPEPRQLVLRCVLERLREAIAVVLAIPTIGA